eukprot:4580420-Alexandrium_andersonii.AAC.1
MKKSVVGILVRVGATPRLFRISRSCCPLLLVGTCVGPSCSQRCPYGKVGPTLQEHSGSQREGSDHACHLGG